MRVNLYTFQEIALSALRKNLALAMNEYQMTQTPQVVSYTAPTGAGKTIIMSALIESIYRGDDQFAEQSNAIVVWLSDSPELNKQSKDKIDLKADRIALGQTQIIEDETFDREVLEDGKIYFLNTQKLGKGNNLIKHSDSRQYTIWETLRNTVERKSDRLYFIIDEAHRGMKVDASKATSIMQKFLKGTTEVEQDSDNPPVKVPPMPVVIGISATIQRFENFVSGCNATIRRVKTEPDEVRSSGLLKDRIIISGAEGFDMDIAVLQAAVDDWREKWGIWDTYCREQHYAYVNPVFIVQVQNGSGDKITETDLALVIQKIEERADVEFKPGELAHTFGQTAETITYGGREIRYVEPSAITENRDIKVVFFKENLSTGWDCPRAETMMSFRRASDFTYISQLLGRMVRTPLQKRVQLYEELNDVKLFLPHFDSDTVKKVVEHLQEYEGSEIPTDIVGQSIEKPVVKIYGIKPTKKNTVKNTDIPPTECVFATPTESAELPVSTTSTSQNESTNNPQAGTPSSVSHQESTVTVVSKNDDTDVSPSATETEELFDDGIDRETIIDAINQMGVTTYVIRNAKIKKYYNSLFDIARLLKDTGNAAPLKSVRSSVLSMIHDHAMQLKADGKYEELKLKVLQFRLKAETFDVFGKKVTDNAQLKIKFTTNEDLERQLRAADAKLGNEGIANLYGKTYQCPEDEQAYAIDVILFAADDNCMRQLESWAKDKFHELESITRPKTVTWSDRFKDRFKRIASDTDEISAHNLELPNGAEIKETTESVEIPYHLYVDSTTGKARLHLNTWEMGVIEEEMKADNFVCWLRNPSRKPWSLTIPYIMDGNKSAYPDLLVVRVGEDGSLELSILEPHNPSLKDNLYKAQGFAKYANDNISIARLQLIREVKDIHGQRFIRLDMTRKDIRDHVLKAKTNQDIDDIFDKYGFLE